MVEMARDLVLVGQNSEGKEDGAIRWNVVKEARNKYQRGGILDARTVSLEELMEIMFPSENLIDPLVLVSRSCSKITLCLNYLRLKLSREA